MKITNYNWSISGVEPLSLTTGIGQHEFVAEVGGRTSLDCPPAIGDSLPMARLTRLRANHRRGRTVPGAPTSSRSVRG